jgi:hypothetical protein
MSAAGGETLLSRLLAGLDPELHDEPRAIRALTAGEVAPSDAIMRFREAEGVTVIVPAAGAEALPWAQITCRVHSSLEAVGMLAAIAETLAREGIACNAVSALHHDHLFLPWARRHDALRVLQALAASAAERAA